MKAQITIAVVAILACGNAKSQTIVDPSTFSGHYTTEATMKVDGKKSDELDMTFDEKTGLFMGVSPKKPDMHDKLKFFADAYHRKWATDTKVWIFENYHMNERYYGEDMFSRDRQFATFIEDGVFVMYASNCPADPVTKERKWILMEKYPIAIMAKDPAKLTMDKKAAAEKAVAQMNAGAAAVTKGLKAQDKAAMDVPNETMTKTDKALKQEVTDLLRSFNSGDDEFLVAYSSAPDWKIITNAATGRILSRQLQVEMVLKNRTSGNCWRQPYMLSAQYNGAGYGKLAFLSKYNMVQCDCAQVAKNK